MSISIENKTVKEVYYSDINGIAKQIPIIYHGNDVVYLIPFEPITFTSNGTWTVPAGIRSVKIDCYGGQGYSFSRTSATGGLGGHVSCILTVVPKQKLYIKVGKQNSNYDVSNNATSIYTDENNWTTSFLIIAGGGGNGSFISGYGMIWGPAGAGGAGGGLTGGNGGGQVGGNGSVIRTSTGGSQSSGGTGGSTTVLGANTVEGSTGSLCTGGNRAPSDRSGNGGQGYYGGGGGATSVAYLSSHANGAAAAGGGGGSSYTNASLCTNVVHQQGVQSGNGYVVISMAK